MRWNRGGRLHDRQFYKKDNAERGIHCREEDLCPVQLLAASPTSGGADAGFGETLGLIDILSIIRSPVCNRTGTLRAVMENRTILVENTMPYSSLLRHICAEIIDCFHTGSTSPHSIRGISPVPHVKAPYE